MGAMLTKCFGAVVNDPAKLESVIGQGFNLFDKDKSGYIEGPEAKAACEQVLKLAKVNNVKPEQLDTVFNKVSGADQKLDKAEFAGYVHKVLGQSAPATAAPAGPPVDAAAAPPVAPVTAQ
eukprot:gene6993-7207_t